MLALLGRLGPNQRGVVGLGVLRRDGLLGAKAANSLRGGFDVLAVGLLELAHDLVVLLAVEGPEAAVRS